MNWCCRAFFLTLSICCFCTSHLGFAFNMMSKCIYFQLWKAYDIFWLWLILGLTFFIPALRFDNNIWQFILCWYNVKRKDQRIRWVLKDQEKEEDEVDSTLKKVVNALNFAVDLLRLRISIAILVGNLRLRTIAPIPALSFLAWDPYRVTLVFDMALLFIMFFFNWFRQFFVCCQLGCCKFYALCFGIVCVGALVMELPMWYFFQHMDRAWCKLKFDEAPVYNRTMESFQFSD